MKLKIKSIVGILGPVLITIFLIGLIVPLLVNLGGPGHPPRRSVTETKIRTVEMALKQYESTYGFLPYISRESSSHDLLLLPSSNPSINQLFAILAGDHSKKIKYLELDRDGKFEDQWGNEFRVAMDLNYDGKIDGHSVNGSDTLEASLVIWSVGKDGAEEFPYSNELSGTNGDNVVSW